MNIPIGDRLFQDIPRSVAKFRENRPKDIEKSVDGKKKLECGPMSNTMVAQPNIGGFLCESSVIPFPVRHKVWLTAAARVPCSNATNIGERKTWTQSEFCTWQNSVTGQEPPKMY